MALLVKTRNTKTVGFLYGSMTYVKPECNEGASTVVILHTRSRLQRVRLQRADFFASISLTVIFSLAGSGTQCAVF